MSAHLQYQTDRILPQPFTAVPTGILQRKCASCGNHTMAGGKCDGCKNKQGVLQRKSSINSEYSEVPPIVHEVLNSSGQPLDKTTRSFFEPRFAHDFSKVPLSSSSQKMSHSRLSIGESTDVYEQEADRVANSIMLGENQENKFSSANELQGDKFDLSHVRLHTDARAAESARAVNALAYTVGNNIVFGAGQFSPETHKGRRLIAHELTHVIQQKNGLQTVQRQSASSELDERAAARSRAQRLAQSIKIHTKVSREVMSAIKKDLAFYKDKARQSYIFVLEPALRAVGRLDLIRETKESRSRPSSLSLLPDNSFCGGSKCFTDEDIYAPLMEMEKRDAEEESRLKEVKIDELRNKTKDWGADQAFAVELLQEILSHTNSPDRRAVSDRIRKPILDRFEKWLKDADKERLDACPANISCESWFDPKKGDYSHGRSALRELEGSLRLMRKLEVTTAEKVYFDVLEYRKKTDPYWLNQRQEAEGMMSGIKSVGGPKSPKPPPRGIRVPAPPKKSPPATTAVIPKGTAPQAAENVASHAAGNKGAGQPGYVSKNFANDGRHNSQILPKQTADGKPITYKEYDIHPYKQGVNRGKERVVIGSDGRRYYTSNHYKNFVEF